MSGSTLVVGIIGVSPVRGWAATAHIPALRALPNYEIRAISTHSAESARAAGEVFGVPAVFSEHQEMVTQPDIDVVAVTVKVPHHRELVSAAIAAGKAVYCEWPLGRDLDDARAMAALAAEQEVRTRFVLGQGGAAVNETLVAVPLADVHGLEALRAELELRFGQTVRVLSGLGTVTVVGSGVGSEPRLLERTLSTAAGLGVLVHAVHTGPLHATLLVPVGALDALTRALHPLTLERA